MKKMMYFAMLYSFLVSSLALYLIITKIGANENPKFTEVTAQRFNIVEPDGALKMVLSNSERQHHGILNGEALPERERPAGLIFFNAVGDECGGLVFDGNKEEAGFVLSIDQFRNDQIMQLQYMEDVPGKERKYGLQLWDYPKENSYAERNLQFKKMEQLETQQEQDSLYEQMKIDSLLMEDRLFLGKRFSKDVGLFIKDARGRERIKIYVNQENKAIFEVMDENGNFIQNHIEHIN